MRVYFLHICWGPMITMNNLLYNILLVFVSIIDNSHIIISKETKETDYLCSQNPVTNSGFFAPVSGMSLTLTQGSLKPFGSIGIKFLKHEIFKNLVSKIMRIFGVTYLASMMLTVSVLAYTEIERWILPRRSV